MYRKGNIAVKGDQKNLGAELMRRGELSEKR